VIEIIYNPSIQTYMNEKLPPLLRAAVRNDLHYFQQHGRSGQLPFVAKLVQLDETWETRTQMTIEGRRYTIRILLRLHNETLAYATMIGDKDQWNPAQGDWYDVYGTISNHVYDQMKGTND